jgi:ABC-type transport system involved in multi-copper enzyme maturation permease subunit
VVLKWILRLLVAAIALPILMCLLFGLGYLLSAVGDEEGSAVVIRTALVVAVLWVFDVLLLVIAVGLGTVLEGSTRRTETTEEIITGPVDET